MYKLIISFFLCFNTILNNSYLFSQQITVVDFDQLQTIYTHSNDTTYFVNFFASWCAPCMKELSSFVSFGDTIKNKKVSLIFVSLDLKKNYEQTISNKLKKLNFTYPVYLLDEANANNWINAIDKNWSGAIPATLILNASKKYKQLFPKTLTETDLILILNKIEP